MLKLRKLAQLGSRLIDSTSKKLAGKFFANFVKLLILKLCQKRKKMKKNKLPKGFLTKIFMKKTHLLVYLFYIISIGSVVWLLLNQN